jgi:hypothetical protein
VIRLLLLLPGAVACAAWLYLAAFLIAVFGV